MFTISTNILVFNLCMFLCFLFNYSKENNHREFSLNKDIKHDFDTQLFGSTLNEQDCIHAIYPVEDFYKCDIDNDHFEEFKIDLTELESSLIRGQKGLTITYHNAGGDLIDFSIGTQFALNQRTIIARASNAEGCFKETSFKLTLVSPPTAQKISNVVECISYELPILGQNNSLFTGINGSGRQLMSGEIIRSTQTIYVYAQLADCSDESEFIVTIQPSLCEEPKDEKIIEFAKFFTPNGDGYNDFWYGAKSSFNWDSSIINIDIYDRYGRFIYTLNNNSEAWNGKYEETPLPSSDYWYLANLVDGQVLKGHFTLKR